MTAPVATLSAHNLRKKYKSRTVVTDVSFELAAGEVVGLLGPNGAGKTTTIGVITSLVNKTAGTVQVFGHDVDQARAEVKACIGLVPQELNFNQFERVHDIVVNQAGFYGVKRRVALERDHYTVADTKVPLRYGMTASAEVVVRERRLIDLALDPFREIGG